MLRSVDYGDSDRIVTLLTDRFGKVSALARGARSSRRRFAGALEPFSLLSAELSLGRGEVGSLRAAQVERALPRVLGDLERMSAAGAALSLVRELMPDRASDPGVFDATVELLLALDAADARCATLLLAFDVQAMTLAGFAPGLSACGVCGKRPGVGQAAELDPVRGFIVCRSCGGAPYLLSGSVRQLLVRAQDDDFHVQDVSECEPAAVAAAQRAVLAFIEHRLERPIERGVPRLR